MGLGMHGGGLASARFFMRAGAKVIITDLKSEKELSYSIKKIRAIKSFFQPRYVLGKHRASDFKTADIVIRNPAVPEDSSYLKIARKQGIPVHTDVSFFMRLLKTLSEERIEIPTIIGITGTKGKSTTASLLHHVLSYCGKQTLLAGNIRKSPLDFLIIKPTHYKLHTTNYIILELSSWHLESLNEHKLAPHIALITNILPDHLNRYKNFNAYKKAKACIFRHQLKNDIVFLNKNDTISRTTLWTAVKSRLLWFGNEGKADINKSLFLHSDSISAVKKVCGYLRLNKKSVQKGILKFKGLEGRLELIATIKGVTYYNDTCATQPDATIFGIGKIFNQRPKIGNLVLIAGGSDKNLQYASLAKAIKKYCSYTFIYKGANTDTASDKIIDELQKVAYKNVAVKSTLSACVQTAASRAKKGDIVLFSPAASSFGKFKHEFDRGDIFKKSVNALKQPPFNQC
jgi:UDP-N-acetylmuramoylalanine--D-glutamate ligase